MGAGGALPELPMPEECLPGCRRRGQGRSGSAAHRAPPAPQLIIGRRGTSDRSRLPQPALCRHSSPPVLSHHTPHTPGNRANPGLPSRTHRLALRNPLPSPAAPSHAPRQAHPPSFLLISSFAQQFGNAESIKWLQSDQCFQGQGVKEESGDRTEVHFPVKVLQ